MKRTIFLFLAYMCCMLVIAGSASKRYTTFLTESGMLYFIKPMQMPKCNGNQTKYGMTFDITYLSGDKDSVSFTTTVVTPNVEKLDSVFIKNESKIVKVKTELIYCEPYKSYYVNRLRFYIKWSEWKDLYSCMTPYVIEFGNHLCFSFHQNKWKEESKTINDIINIIELSK